MSKFLIVLLFTGFAFGQKITVADLQIKLEPNSTQELMYGFADGDRIILTIEEANKNTISEVSVTEYPNNLKYKGQQVTKEKDREFKVTGKSVFIFKITNSTKGKRTCTIKIQRVPKKSEYKNFNTAVKWVKVQDTVWNSVTRDVVTGYDTVYTQKTRKVVASTKKYEEMVLDKSQRVNAVTSFKETKTSVSFTLPVNVISQDESKKVVAWAYWVGVGEESNEFWKQNRKMIVGAVQGAASYFTTPLGGIAAGAITNLALPVNGEDVEYALLTEQNSKLFFQDKPYKSIDSGQGIAAYKRITDTDKQQGKFVIVLANDNYVQPLDVNVKVSAIMEHTKFKEEAYRDMKVTPRYGKKIIAEPQINSREIPIPVEK